MAIVITFPFPVRQTSNTEIEIDTRAGSHIVQVQVDPEGILSVSEETRARAWQKAAEAATIAIVRELMSVDVQ